MIFQLDKELWFPSPELADEDGCLAIGGDLSVDRLLLAYSNGIFPWYDFRRQKEPMWFCPHERFVIFPEEIHISHSMRTLLRKGQYVFSVNRDFEAVIGHCSSLRYDEDGAWLGDDMIEAYTELYRQGFAASVEVWNRNKELVGGLYGVNIGRAFFGESMFSLVPNGSKLALIFLAKTFGDMGGKLIDCQFETAHLKSMGGRYISYSEYMQIINSDYSMSPSM
ncbi:MAG: leucyl/phenylalanyl-tRNA--protein transferase [Prevotella sp.]|nr:leucyl/phenylalanyl-tRNA--protein transferase [Prevotella sp.]